MQTLNPGGTQKKVLIDFKFKGNEITGRGSDDSQEFKVKGSISKQDGSVNIEILYDKMKLEVFLGLILKLCEYFFEVSGTLSLDFHFKVSMFIVILTLNWILRVK